MQFKTSFFGVMLAVISALGVNAQTLLTDYGSSDPQPFTLTFETNAGSFTQGANTGTFSTSGVGVLIRGTFTAVDLTAIGAPGSLQLNLTFNTSFSGSIDYTIGSGPGTALGYSFTGSSLTGTQTITFLRNASLDTGSVTLSNINRATLTADSPNFTLNTLSAISAVPEPAAYAALFGVASLGFVAWRRRRPA